MHFLQSSNVFMASFFLKGMEYYVMKASEIFVAIIFLKLKAGLVYIRGWRGGRGDINLSNYKKGILSK